MTIRITGTGSMLPEKIVTNFDMAEIVETSDEWIRERTEFLQEIPLPHYQLRRARVLWKWLENLLRM